MSNSEKPEKLRKIWFRHIFLFTIKFIQTVACIFSPDVKLTEFRTSVTSKNETASDPSEQDLLLKNMETLIKQMKFLPQKYVHLLEATDSAFRHGLIHR